jgi:hypothetical protein
VGLRASPRLSPPWSVFLGVLWGSCLALLRDPRRVERGRIRENRIGHPDAIPLVHLRSTVFGLPDPGVEPVVRVARRDPRTRDGQWTEACYGAGAPLSPPVLALVASLLRPETGGDGGGLRRELPHRFVGQRRRLAPARTHVNEAREPDTRFLSSAKDPFPTPPAGLRLTRRGWWRGGASVGP